jgi:hypothetical protein
LKKGEKNKTTKKVGLNILFNKGEVEKKKKMGIS